MEFNFKFQPISFSWVAVHPRPLGIINFIGEVGFGAFPTIFYRHFLKGLYYQGYTIIARPIYSHWNCWTGAINLMNESLNYNLFSGIFAEAKRLGYNSEIYLKNYNSKQLNNFWLGHGLGCQYLILLEIISNLNQEKYRIFLNEYLDKKQTKAINEYFNLIQDKQFSIINEPSIFISPKIIGGCKTLNQLTEEEIYNLIKYSDLFNCLGMIVPEKSHYTTKNIKDLKQNVPQDLYKLISEKNPGNHFSPLFFSSKQVQLEKSVIRILKLLEERLKSSIG
ncbi:hypothetical protein STA3757_00140 [Stanieria sp. NIES-3757]|nr:hypothetical protein STA3757_00140 [Stanieria sp. NIES-3757]